MQRFEPDLSHAEAMILSAIVVLPLVLALAWEHIKSVKLGEIEISEAQKGDGALTCQSILW